MSKAAAAAIAAIAATNYDDNVHVVQVSSSDRQATPKNNTTKTYTHVYIGAHMRMGKEEFSES